VDGGCNHQGREMGAGYFESAIKKEKAAHEGGKRRGRVLFESTGTSGLYLGVTQHPCDKAHTLLVRQPSAAEGCQKIGRRFDVSYDPCT